MDSWLLSIGLMIEVIKKEKLWERDPYSLVNPSAYDTAWLAMIPDSDRPGQPMFQNCLDWVLRSQMEDGFWGGSDGHGLPTIESLPATLACLVVLTKWNVGKDKIERGLAFLGSNTEKLLDGTYGSCQRWFVIIFPGMIELARKAGLYLPFHDHLKVRLIDVFNRRQRILETEELIGDQCPPLLSFLEALPSSYKITNQVTNTIRNKITSGDGSLYQSPSATARAFMLTGNSKCSHFLQALVQRCPNGVPPTYPLDEELIRLCLVNQIQRLGLAQHFTHEIETILSQAYRSMSTWGSEQFEGKSTSLLQFGIQLHKDALAFRLLRMQGYHVSPWRFCWFMRDEEIRQLMEKNYEQLASVMLQIYRATELMFPGEMELKEAMSFSKKLLVKATRRANQAQSFEQHHVAFARLIEHEIGLPWAARMDHLEHRMWIEEKDMNALWMARASFHRLSDVVNGKLLQLAMLDYEFRQFIYKNELEEVKRWSRMWGLSEMGFGREKTTYCYFAIASSFSLPYQSDMRLLVAKSAVLITVADDFFDEEGSLHDLTLLTQSVQRWDGKGLKGHSATIFNALDNFVKETSEKYLQEQGHDITRQIQEIWCETFEAWLMEAKWSRSGGMPSTEEYLATGMASIATHTVVLPTSCFLDPSFPISKLRPKEYETLTRLLMLIPRLLNDIQSYQKEKEQGKLNYVLLYLKENPKADIEDSIAHVRNILETKRQELLQHVLLDEFSDLPKLCKLFHLACVKVFQMFFNTSNRYDSNTDMLEDIGKALYMPLNVGFLSLDSIGRDQNFGARKEFQQVRSALVRPFNSQTDAANQASLATHPRGFSCRNVLTPSSFRLSFN
uniref:Terpene synthase 26 n=1 Tax=Aquilaria sinensis TaxID=210372 RepID=A0A8E8ASV6_9ROSI|nr:terpene synthase 26 [Aquilaria sinensis]